MEHTLRTDQKFYYIIDLGDFMYLLLENLKLVKLLNGFFPNRDWCIIWVLEILNSKIPPFEVNISHFQDLSKNTLSHLRPAVLGMVAMAGFVAEFVE